MARSRRPTYAPEFKAEAVRMLRASSAPVSRIARDLGVSAASLRTWSEAATAPSVPALKEAERLELVRLRREVRELPGPLRPPSRPPSCAPRSSGPWRRA